MDWAELHQLEKMVGKLTFTALKLSPGVERRDSPISIGNFRNRIAAMMRSASRPKELKLKAALLAREAN